MITRKHMVRFADELFRLAAKEKAATERRGMDTTIDGTINWNRMAVLRESVRIVARVIGEDNPRFDEQRFLVAAGCLNAYNQLEE